MTSLQAADTVRNTIFLRLIPPGTSRPMRLEPFARASSIAASRKLEMEAWILLQSPPTVLKRTGR
jgi:hypothetical protein